MSPTRRWPASAGGRRSWTCCRRSRKPRSAPPCRTSACGDMRRRRQFAAAVLLGLLAAAVPAMAQTFPEIINGARWGESSAELLRHFGAAATALRQPLDFGDSYVDVVLRRVSLGGYLMIAY